MINRSVEVLFSLFDNGGKMEKVKLLYDEVSIKKLKLNEILELADRRKIDIEKSFKVRGYISRLAPIIEPNTYVNQINKVDINSEKIDLEKGEKTWTLSVKPYSLPVTNGYSENGKVIAFLYLDEADERFKFAIKDDNINLEIKESNKFIPIRLDEGLIYKYSNKVVELIVKVVVFNPEKVTEIYSYKTNEYKNICSWFYDIYNENIISIALDVEEVIKVIEEKKDDNKISFAVEYKLVSNKLSASEINDRKNKTIKKFSINSSFTKRINECGIQSVLSYDDIFINTIDEYIGFYTIIDMNNRMDYRNKLRKLESTVLKIKKALGKDIRTDISFISDYNKIDLFK